MGKDIPRLVFGIEPIVRGEIGREKKEESRRHIRVGVSEKRGRKKKGKERDVSVCAHKERKDREKERGRKMPGRTEQTRKAA